MIRWYLSICTVSLGLAVAGCEGVTWLNAQPRASLDDSATPPGVPYLGWRVFQARCAGCHGPSAEGTVNAPGLVEAMQVMGPRTFVERVLHRYAWELPLQQKSAAENAADAWVETVLRRQEPPLMMPAWRNEPSVNAHILDLYAYLSARAQGRFGVSPPAPDASAKP